MSDETEHLLTFTQAADRLGVRQYDIEDAIAAGLLRYLEIGGKHSLRVVTTDLEAAADQIVMMHLEDLAATLADSLEDA